MAFKLTSRGSNLRKYAAHSMAWKSPFGIYKEGSEEYKSWNNLLKKYPNLAVDISRVAGKQWNGTKPCDDGHRATDMEEEGSLDERWERMILERMTQEEIETAANAGCGMRTECS